MGLGTGSVAICADNLCQDVIMSLRSSMIMWAKTVGLDGECLLGAASLYCAVGISLDILCVSLSGLGG